MNNSKEDIKLFNDMMLLCGDIYYISQDFINRILLNNDLPDDFLIKLYDISDEKTKTKIAGLPNLPNILIQKICSESSFSIIRNILDNKNIVLEEYLVRKMYDLKKEGIAFARSIHTPVDILLDISILHPSEVIYNKNLTTDAINLIYEHNKNYDDFLISILRSDNCLEHILIDIYNKCIENNNYILYDMLCHVAYNKNITLQISKSLLEMNHKTINKFLAKNQYINVEILEKLSDYKDINVIFNLLKNKSFPEYLLGKFYNGYTRWVLEHPNCPDYLKSLSK